VTGGKGAKSKKAKVRDYIGSFWRKLIDYCLSGDENHRTVSSDTMYSIIGFRKSIPHKTVNLKFK